MPTIIGKLRKEKLDLASFLETVDAGITQANNDATIIASATTLEELRPVLDHLNNRQLNVMKAVRFVANTLGKEG
jgi:hypothetical protein